MSTRWLVNCPYCNAEVARGYGHLKVSKVWVPFIRCQICGRLMNTGSKEYLNMTVDERLKLKNNAQTIDDIKSSLERTNHGEYRAILTKYGHKFYPITDEDEQRFAGIKQFSECKPTFQTTESLYDLGILIKEEVKDEKTGGIKQEVLDDRQKQYKQTRKIILLSLLTGFLVAGIFAAIIGGANSATDLSFLALLPAIAAGAAVAFGMNYYYKHKNKTEAAQKETGEQRKAEEARRKLEQERRKQADEEVVVFDRTGAYEEERQRAIAKSDEARKRREAEEARKQKAEQDTATCKTLLDECGMQFFIEYYPQLKRLPISDINVSDHYFPERQVRLTAAKKIVDLGLSECALHYIIENFGDIFPEEVIGQAKTLLNVIEK